MAFVIDFVDRTHPDLQCKKLPQLTMREKQLGLTEGIHNTCKKLETMLKEVRIWTELPEQPAASPFYPFDFFEDPGEVDE
jgi:hypothetical protein